MVNLARAESRRTWPFSCQHGICTRTITAFAVWNMRALLLVAETARDFHGRGATKNSYNHVDDRCASAN